MQPLSNVVPNVIRSILANSPLSEGKFAFAWRQAVGAAMDRVATASLRDDGTVVVVVEDAAWRKEVKRSQALILSKMQHLLGASVAKKLKIVGGRTR